MKVQTLKKDSNDRGDGNHSEPKFDFRPIWLGMRDSNPRSWDQNPVPYRLANPHC